jgi:hypothetical protein
MSCKYLLHWLLAALAMVMLSGCFGGPIGVQIARSLLLQGADKVTANAIEAQERKDEFARHNAVLKDTEPDEYWAAFVTSSFQQAPPADAPLPDYRIAEYQAPPTTPVQIEASRLVRVEIWNLLIGDEKRAVLEKARLLGSNSVPPPDQWQHWQVATGGMQSEKTRAVTFLIPPDFGKITSGESALVEIEPTGGLHIARYPVNQARAR